MRILTLSVVAIAAVSFSEPAPEPVEKSRDLPASEPQPNPDVTFRAAPKPLPAGAVTSDWPSFLGPTHNMFSPETKLLKEFPKGGPTLVWEMKRGDGFASPAVVGDRLILFHRLGSEEVVECLNA